MSRRKIISTIALVVCLGAIVGVIFSFIQTKDNERLETKQGIKTESMLNSESSSQVAEDIGITTSASTSMSGANIGERVLAGIQILNLQGKTSKEKAMALYGSYATSSLKIKSITQDISNNISHKETVLEIQIADTPELQSLGLSGRDGLLRTQGLLFIFKKEGYYPFWMKDMLFPIDMIWIDANKKIVHIEHNVSPDTYPRSFASPQLATYVLETAAGIAKEKGIKVGDIVEFNF